MNIIHGLLIIMANVPSNDPNVDAPANVPAPANPEHASAQPVGHGDGFHPCVGDNIPNNQNGWMEEDPEEDPEDDLEENNDDDWEMDDEAEVIEPYTGQHIPPMLRLGQNFSFCLRVHLTANLLIENSKVDIKKKFKEQDLHFVGLGCDNVEIDRTVRKAMSKLSGVKKLVKGLSDRFDLSYEREQGFQGQENYGGGSKDGLPVPSGPQVRKPPAEPFARSTPALRSDDPYVVARDAAAAITTSDSDDDDDTAFIDSHH
ncbi:hypothetical protein Tco_0683512 [Tanacetum coccineum]|uniref:Uncharacterized protein n=1 Tax=Tanacetum coccineum TaxID=301880 RepID=A0ABQ4XVD7_9ASTR